METQCLEFIERTTGGYSGNGYYYYPLAIFSEVFYKIYKPKGNLFNYNELSYLDKIWANRYFYNMIIGRKNRRITDEENCYDDVPWANWMSTNS